MGRIFVTSDTHFGHDREFIWGPRGFKNVHEMNKVIITNWNQNVDMEDDVYHLGDVMLGDNEVGLKYLKQLKGKIHIICGNHDTPTRRQLYADCYNVVEVCDAKYLKVGHQNFFLCHYPTITANLDDNGSLSRNLINLYGHTHQATNFYNGMPCCYHVGMDSHNCTPVLIETALADIRTEIQNCKQYIKGEK